MIKIQEKKTKLTTCSNVSPSLVELSNEELEIITANLFHDRRRLNKLGFFIIIPVRFVRPIILKSFSDFICSVFFIEDIDIELRIFN